MVGDGKGSVLLRSRRTQLAVRAVALVVALAVLGLAVQLWVVLVGSFLGHPQDANTLPQVLNLELRSGGQLRLADVPMWLRLLSAVPLLLQAAIVISAAVYLVRVVRHVARGEAFVPGTLSAVRRLSRVLLGGGIIQGLVSTGIWVVFILWTARPALREDVMGVGLDLPQWPVLIILLGVVTAALSAAFHDGARLEDEVEGLV